MIEKGTSITAGKLIHRDRQREIVFEAVLNIPNDQLQTEFANNYLLKKTGISEQEFLSGFEYRFYRKLSELPGTSQDHRLLFPHTYQCKEEHGARLVELLVRRARRGSLLAISEQTTEEEALRHVGALSLTDTLLVLKDLGTAFDYLHSPEVGYLHRDLKPGNVVADDEGFYLTDFGISLPFFPPFEFDRNSYYDLVIWLLGRIRPVDQVNPQELNKALEEVYGADVLLLLKEFKKDESLSFSEFGERLSEVIQRY